MKQKKNISKAVETGRTETERALAETEEHYRARLEKEVQHQTAALQASRDDLRSILDTTLIQMSILEAVRDKNGKVTDLRINAVNKELERETGRTDLVGKLYAAEYPGIRKSGLFDLILKAIETNEPQGTEYYYPHEGYNKWFSCTFVKMNDGVVATNMDITPRKEAEEKIRRMEVEQQFEILRVSMNTLEEERYRISESLHNGIAQLLYGVKISLAGLKRTLDDVKFAATKTYTTELLNDAIIETRRVSHDLMPTTLEEFGLESAINHICLQLSDGIKFTCIVTGLRNRLEKYLELAIYRIVQELVTNVYKHSKGDLAFIEVNAEPEKITIRVTDNGIGMPAPTKGDKGKKGIGHTSIRSKIKLLNGKVAIQSAKGKGTTVTIMIPMPERTLLA